MRESNSHKPTGQPWDELDARLQQLRLCEPPSGLREQCLPPDGEVRTLSLPERRERLRKSGRRWVGSIGGLAVAAVVWLLLWVTLFSRSVPTASAEVLRAAMSAFGRIDAVRVLTQVDDGPGTQVLETWELWCHRSLGHRTEHGAYVDIYDAVRRRKYTVNCEEGTVREVERYDPVTVLEFLRRCEVKQNIEVLLVRAAEGAGTFRDETLGGEKRGIRRLSALNPRGRPIAAEIDPQTARVLWTESWTVPVKGSPRSKRVLRRFEYPAKDQVDPALFQPPHEEGLRYLSASAAVEERIQCLSNMRSLMWLISRYAGAHGGELPAALSDLEDVEGFDPALLACPRGPDSYAYRAQALGIEREEDLPWDAAVIECPNHPGWLIQAFGGGHAAAEPLKD